MAREIQFSFYAKADFMFVWLWQKKLRLFMIESVKIKMLLDV